MAAVETEVIYCGDNLEVLDTYVPAKSVDLIYIDPPFNSNRQYEVFWGEASEKRAFADRFGNVQFYIDWMRPRIHQLYRVLKPGGSFYYHCDPHASHYVKALLDDVFGFNSFINEIVWERAQGHHDSKKFRAVHDTILLYAKGKPTTFNHEYGPHDPSYIDSHYNLRDKSGRAYQLTSLVSPNPRPNMTYVWRGHQPPPNGWRYSLATMERQFAEGRIELAKKPGGRPRLRRFLDEQHGIALGDVWTDIAPVNSQADQRMGYPTQKPMPLMERIVQASSNEGDVILDAFCGCGTTLEAASKNKRRWVGIDMSPTACRVMSARLEKHLGLRDDQDFRVANLPKTEEDLQKMPPFEFQNWACLALGGFSNAVKSGDFGIDGRVYPADIPKRAGREKGQQSSFLAEVDRWYPIQVKQKAKAGRPDIDSFETALRRDKRTRGYFVAFGFSRDAEHEIKRANRDDGLDIRPITVAELLQYEQIVA